MEAETRPPTLPELDGAHHHGDERRAWSEPFLRYAYAIVAHPNYKDMPCTLDDAGKVDWTIPTGRTPGSKNWDGNARRREWWRAKAVELGIPTEGHWISKAAKRLHPWGWKPCQTCGRWMRLSYSYPTARTLAKLNAVLPEDGSLEVPDYLDIYEVADHLVETIGAGEARRLLAEVFPDLGDLGGLGQREVKRRLEENLVATEPRGRLSPGAMSNAPDRLDGFHTYNLCCRSRQDTGRSLDNLRTYGVDRRAFEHWSEGDWEAANLLMSRVVVGVCTRCGETKQLTADHIGPISLGFRHTPHFEAVCGACNSAKNNRMSLRDVLALLALEADGEEVVSWQAKSIWDRSKGRVDDDAAALRLSKLMNVNQHEFLRLLLRGLSAGVPDALMQFLSPEHAELRVTFEGLDRATLRYGRIVKSPRQPTYARSKAARLVRIAFESLDDYADKEARNVQAVPEDALSDVGDVVQKAVRRAVEDESAWREPLLDALNRADSPTVRENRLQEIIGPGFYVPTHDYGYIREAFESYMDRVGEVLAARLDDDHAIKLWDEALGDLGSR